MDSTVNVLHSPPSWAFGLGDNSPCHREEALFYFCHAVMEDVSLEVTNETALCM